MGFGNDLGIWHEEQEQLAAKMRGVDDSTRDRVRRIYADNIELKSRIEVLEGQVQQLFEQLSLLSQQQQDDCNKMKQQSSGGGGNEEKPPKKKKPKKVSVVDFAAGNEGKRHSRMGELGEEEMEIPPRPPPKDDATMTTGSMKPTVTTERRHDSKVVSPSSPYEEAETKLATTTTITQIAFSPPPPNPAAPSPSPFAQERFSKPMTWMRDYLLELSKQRLQQQHPGDNNPNGEVQDLVSYCTVFKSTADALPLEALDNVTRSRIFLDGLPERLTREVMKKCWLDERPEGLVDFDGIFVVVGVVVKSVNVKKGWGEEETRRYVELMVEVGKAWERHLEFVAETGMRLPGLDMKTS